MLTIEAQDVEQPPTKERCNREEEWKWFLPDDLERLRRPDPKQLAYPLREEPRP